MADSPISGLTERTTPQDTDLLPIEDPDEPDNYKVKVSNLRQGASAQTFTGNPTGETALVWPIAYNRTLKSSDPGEGYAVTAPSTVDQTFTIKKNGTDVGTATITVSSNAATFSVGSDVSLTPGDRLTITADKTYAQYDSWDSGSSTHPTDQNRFAIAYHDGKIYALGGGNGGAPYDDFYSYDIASDTWTSEGSLQTDRYGPIATVIDGKIYLYGGYSDDESGVSSTIEAYDISAGTWDTTLTSAPTSNRFCMGGVINSKWYIAGGSSDNTELLEYDPSTDSWDGTLTAMPTGRYGGAGGAYDGTLYVAGGFSGYKAMESYDPGTDSWTTLTDLPAGRARNGSLLPNLAGELGLIGGEDSGSTKHDDVYTYDVSADSWDSDKPLYPWDAYQHGTVAVGSTWYGVAGYTDGTLSGHVAKIGAEVTDPDIADIGFTPKLV